MLLHIALASALVIQPADGSQRVVNAQRVQAATGAPAIDGVLNDPVWAQADSLSDFIQMEPEPGAPARFRTVGRIAFDDQAVYVALRAYDPEPDKIMAQLTRRDEDSSSDWLMLGFDSRFDRRTAYVFGVNPVGVKRDMVITNDVEGDDGWDTVWQVETRTDSLGWTAEFRIPLSALRFSTQGDGVWGFQVVRVVQRVREESSWTAMRQNEPRLVSVFGELHGMKGLPAPRRLELLPYSVTELRRAPGNPANPFYEPTRLQAAAGLDLKYGLTSDLTLDATINPDFGQVEADPSQVNLSAFETFLPEKRPFFTEGADIFRFGLSLGDGDGANEQLFYSRRVGRAPQGDPALGEGEFADAPIQSRILGAAKLSGRVKGGWSVGLLNAVTGEEHARIGSHSGPLHSQVVEPLTNYSVLRVRRDLNEGRTQFGAVGTGVVRRLDDTGMDWLRSSAIAGGVDFSHRFASDRWRIDGSLLGSRIQGSRESILGAQRSSARYFQRPDADHLSLSPEATSLQGWFASYSAMKIAGGNWRGGLLGQLRSPGFEVNDLGYQRNADQIFNVLWLGYTEIEPGKLFRQYGLNTNLWSVRSFGWEDLGVGGNVNGHAQFRNYWRGSLGLGHRRSAVDPTALRGGPSIRTPDSYNGWMSLYGDSRKAFTPGIRAFWGAEEESGDRRLNLSLDGEWRLTSSTQISLAPSYGINRSAWQYVTSRADAAGETHYLFSGIDQRTVSLRTRVNHTFTPELGIQLYAEPFVSAGTYSGLKAVADPGAARFDDRLRDIAPERISRDGDDYVVRMGEGESSTVRFSDPDFNVRALNLNAVLRWEYRPGSTVFFVWSHGRGSSDGEGNFRFTRDLGELFRQRSTNVLLIKANWWLSR